MLTFEDVLENDARQNSPRKQRRRSIHSGRHLSSSAFQDSDKAPVKQQDGVSKRASVKKADKNKSQLFNSAAADNQPAKFSKRIAEHQMQKSEAPFGTSQNVKTNKVSVPAGHGSVVEIGAKQEKAAKPRGKKVYQEKLVASSSSDDMGSVRPKDSKTFKSSAFSDKAPQPSAPKKREIKHFGGSTPFATGKVPNQKAQRPNNSGAAAAPAAAKIPKTNPIRRSNQSNGSKYFGSKSDVILPSGSIIPIHKSNNQPTGPASYRS
eukprot:TRINITY_DN66366_c3_g1_i3.p2 TRINITY_DN66366_c3_g1~~TRINITY_DN66366_c3_g1_i3.p2  ORF type:complete len:264 (+),score=132.82 TRINITY_DN66366_c3_g1_i3:152-943(+)